MCYHTSTPPTAELKKYLDEQRLLRKERGFVIEEYEPYFHVSGFSHPEMPVIASDKPEHVVRAVWGFIPHWIKDEKKAAETMNITLNAKSETVFTTPMYRDAAPNRRCLVMVNGFFEWKWDDPNKKTSEKRPHFIYMPDRKPFALGGIYNDWRGTRTMSIITTQANELMADIHNTKKRMPLIMPEEMWDLWLNKETPRDEVEHIMLPFPEGALQVHEISKLITDRSQDSNVRDVQEAV